jgi:transposase-like protein
LATQFQVHPNQIQTWKKQLLNHAPDLFEKRSGSAKDPTSTIKDLHAKIGQLTIEKDFLSKALGGLE